MLIVGALQQLLELAVQRAVVARRLARSALGARGAEAVLNDFEDDSGLGRGLSAPPGRALLASVLLRPVAPPGSLYACTAAAALAACDACEGVAGVRAGVKWPNDLVAGPPGATAKLAGILAESDPGAPGGPPGSVAVVVGVGMNVDWAPEGATCVAALAAPGAGAPPTVPALLDALLDALARRVPLLDAEEGRAEVLGSLRERCVTLGRPVRVEAAGKGVVTGTAVRIDARGRLVVAAHAPQGGTGGAEVTVAAGEPSLDAHGRSRGRPDARAAGSWGNHPVSRLPPASWTTG